jgi:hypothetical protein
MEGRPPGILTDRCSPAVGFANGGRRGHSGNYSLIVGLIASLSILVCLGVLLLVVGLVLNLVPIGGTRRSYH